MFKILFVCAGSTCRSPMASMLFNKRAKELEISNVKSSYAGLAVEFGSCVADEAKVALKRHGVKRIVGKPTQICGKHLAENNLIVCATEDYKQALANWADKKFEKKISCYKDFCGQDIFDPYGKGQLAYDRCIEDIEKAINIILEALIANGVAKYRKAKSV